MRLDGELRMACAPCEEASLVTGGLFFAGGEKMPRRGAAMPAVPADASVAVS